MTAWISKMSLWALIQYYTIPVFPYDVLELRCNGNVLCRRPYSNTLNTVNRKQ